MTRFATTSAICLPALLALLALSPAGAAAAAPGPVAAVGEVPLVGASLAGVQEKAVHKAMESAVDAAVQEAVAPSVYGASQPAIAGSLLKRAEEFVAHYSIEGREVSDALYTVRLQVTLDLPLLRRRMAALGLLGTEAGAGRYSVVALGVPEPVLRSALIRLEIALGEDAVLTPRRFEGDAAGYDLATVRPLQEVLDALAGPELAAEASPDGIVLRFPPPTGALAPLGQEVPFYRKAPRGGEANPEDIRGVESVPWQETEPDDTPAQAELLPLGQGVLGSIDPASDRDMFRVELPPRTPLVSVAVGSTGPGEFRPRVRVFAASGTRSGSLVWEGKSSSRGRALRASFALPAGVGALLVSVEDDLGRYGTAFPYRLVVAAGERKEEP